MKRLAASVLRLSDILTRERVLLPTAYLAEADLREAYVHYFLPPNMAKIQIVLEELARHPAGLFSRQTLRIMDLGSGPGTAIAGALHFFSRQVPRPVLECIAVDQVSDNLTLAEELFVRTRDSIGMQARLQTVCSSLMSARSTVKGPCDLLILSNVLNELFPGEGRAVEKRSAMLHELCSAVLAEDGTCLIIEPALRETSRDLLAVRDTMISIGYVIYGPCLGGKQCPARENPKDWCHEDIPWQPTWIMTEIDRLTGLRKDSLKFSWLVIRKDDRSLSDIHGTNCFRVVSEQMPSKGKLEYFICNGINRRRVVRLNKDTSGENKEYSDLHRGDIISCVGLVDDDNRCRIGKSTIVSRRGRVSLPPQNAV